MKNKMFSGWKDILLFTFKQELTKKYKMVTVILAVILFAGGFAFNIISATSQQKSDTVSPVEKVYLIDNSGIEDIEWNDSKQLDKEKFPKVVFEETSLDIQELGTKLENSEPTSVIASVSKEEKSFKIQIYLPYGSEITKGNGESLAKEIKAILKEGMINKSEIDSDKIAYVVSGIETEYSTAGEEMKGEDSMMYRSLLPMVFMLALYFMVIIYGQSMGQIVIVEKSSKLMETLLVMTRPYGLIFGKILATAGMAILQIAICIGSVIFGFILGDSYARDSVYAGYDNPVISVFKELASDEVNRAFTSEAIVLTVVAICLAFLFYCMLAGAISSFASKADELGSVMMFYNMFLIIGFLGSYVLPTVNGQEWIKVLVRLIPMSSAFMLPGEILLGTVMPGAAIIYILVQLAWIIVTAILAGKIYRDQVFYNGKSLKDRLPWMKKKEDDDNENQWQILHDGVGETLKKSQKMGYLFLTLVPFVIFLVMQVLSSVIVMSTIVRWDFRGIDIASCEAKELADYYHRIETTLNSLTMMIIHSFIIITFGLWLYFIRRGIDKNSIIHIRSLFNKKIAIVIGTCIVCGLGLLVLANGVVGIENKVVPSIVEKYVDSTQKTGMGMSIFTTIAAVCMAPIGEELLCRGVCLHFGKKALGNFWYANILQALIFGIMHMNWVQGVYAFIIGLVLGVIVERYDSLLPSMIIHFIVNFSSSTWFPRVFDMSKQSIVTSTLMVTISGAIVVAMLLLTRMRSEGQNE